MMNGIEWLFSIYLSTAIVAFGAGYYVAKSRYIRMLGFEEERTRKWKTRAYKMAWGIPLDESDLVETKYAQGPLPLKPYTVHKTSGGAWTSCK
jgi:hypothetical protein